MPTFFIDGEPSLEVHSTVVGLKATFVGEYGTTRITILLIGEWGVDSEYSLVRISPESLITTLQWRKMFHPLYVQTAPERYSDQSLNACLIKL